MKDYIERAAAIERFTVAEKEADCPGVDFTVIKRMLSDIPAADVVEVRHGRWIHPVPGDGENHCSVCHAEQPWFYGYGYYEPDYCPNCGARMDKEDEP